MLAGLRLEGSGLHFGVVCLSLQDRGFYAQGLRLRLGAEGFGLNFLRVFRCETRSLRVV